MKNKVIAILLVIIVGLMANYGLKEYMYRELNKKHNSRKSSTGTARIRSPTLEKDVFLNCNEQSDQIVTGGGLKVTRKQCNKERSIAYSGQRQIATGLIQKEFRAYYSPNGINLMSLMVVVGFDTQDRDILLNYLAPRSSDRGSYCESRTENNLLIMSPKSWFQKQVDDMVAKTNSGTALIGYENLIDPTRPCGYLNPLQVIGDELIWVENPAEGGKKKGYKIITVEKE